MIGHCPNMANYNTTHDTVDTTQFLAHCPRVKMSKIHFNFLPCVRDTNYPRTCHGPIQTECNIIKCIVRLHLIRITL